MTVRSSSFFQTYLQVLLDAGMTCMVSDFGMSVLLPSSGMKTESGEYVVPWRLVWL